MTGPVRLALAFLPLATYFFVLGRWQSGGRPKVVSGPGDVLLLAFGLGGMLAFGPIGGFLVGAAFPRASPWAWAAVASLVALVGMASAHAMRTRLVVYHVEEPELSQALGKAFAEAAGPPSRTLRGFEDGRAARGVTVEVGRALRFAVVQAYGDRPEALIAALAPALGARLRGVTARPSPVAPAWFALSGAVLIGLFLAWLAMVGPGLRGRWPRAGP